MSKKKAPVAQDHIVEPLWPLVQLTTNLLYDEANARLHSHKNLQAIKSSLLQFGQRTPIVAQRRPDGTTVVRKGNGTLEAARQLIGDGDARWEQMAIVVIEEDNTTATGYAIADNRTGELAQWDDHVLGRLLAGLDADAPEMVLGLGFDEEELDALIEELQGDEEVSESRRGTMRQELEVDLSIDAQDVAYEEMVLRVRVGDRAEIVAALDGFDVEVVR